MEKHFIFLLWNNIKTIINAEIMENKLADTPAFYTLI